MLVTNNFLSLFRTSKKWLQQQRKHFDIIDENENIYFSISTNVFPLHFSTMKFFHSCDRIRAIRCFYLYYIYLSAAHISLSLCQLSESSLSGVIISTTVASGSGSERSSTTVSSSSDGNPRLIARSDRRETALELRPNGIIYYEQELLMCVFVLFLILAVKTDLF